MAMIYILLNNKLYMKISNKELKEVDIFTLAGRSIKDIYLKDNSLILEVI